MPRAKDTAPATAELEQGFAALEAKVEEVQLDAAIEAELATEDAAAAAPLLMLEQTSEGGDAAPAPAPTAADVPSQSSGVAQLRDPSAPLKVMLGAFAACTESGLRLQAETFARFSRVRSPGDLLAAQMDYGRQAFELYTGNIARFTQALPAIAR
jgi:hypothetical protein